MNELNEIICNAVEDILSEAMHNIAEKLPNDEEKENFLNRLDYNMRESVRGVINGQDYREYLKRGAYETSVWLANHYADVALNRVIKEMPRGKNRDTIKNSMELLTHRGIESLCRGASLEEIKQELTDCAKDQLKSYVATKSRHWANEATNTLYKNVKFGGKGSRKINRHLKTGTGIIADELGTQLASNIGDVIDGRKKLSSAVTDIAINTTKNASVTWVKGQGAEVAAEAFKSLAKTAEKQIQNELTRNVTTAALTKLSNANTLIQGAGYLMDVGKSIKQLMDGEITKAQFMRVVGEKGTAFVSSSAFTLIGKLALGSAGVAIAPMIGYLATNCLYGAVLQAFEEAEMSRKRYEAIHEFCEYQIREMKKQREEFERKVAEFLKNRQEVIDDGLNQFEESVRHNDFDKMSAALNGIAEEFGGSLQFKTFDEFDEFMSDDDSVLEL